MSGRLIALEKQPDISLVGVGGNWRHIFEKCVLRATRTEDTNAFQNDQLCDRPRAGIEGTIHGVKLFGTQNNPQKTGNFYSWTQKMLSTRSTRL